MERIGLHNYEAFLLDYLEGNLDESGLAELKLFALMYPELEIDLGHTVLPVLEKEELSLDLKNNLKKRDITPEEEELLNYLEGHLTEDERQQIERKLLSNKDLAAEWALLKRTILIPSVESVFATKESLKKTEDDVLLNNRVIAYTEKLLTASEKAAFETELASNPVLQTEWALVSKTILKPDHSIVYPRKEALRRSGRVLVLFSRSTLAAMAAAVVLIICFAFIVSYYTSGNSGSKSSLAQKKMPGKNVLPENKQNVLRDALQPFASSKTNPTQNNIAIKRTLPLNIRSQKDTVSSPLIIPTNPLTEIKKTDPLTEPDQVPPSPMPETDKTLLSSNQQVDKSNLKYQDTSVFSEEGKQNLVVLEEEVELPAGQPKQGFWKRAVKAARRANSMGIKAVDGEEKGSHNYSLSFNSFSVEKR